MIGFFAAQAMNQGPRLWTPADLPVQPAVWCDWDSAVTDVSGFASGWSNSKGAIGGSFSQSNSGSRPEIIASGVGGRRALRFDGINDFLRMSGSGAANIFRNTGAGAIFTVLRKRGVDESAVRGVVYSAVPTGQSRFSVNVGLSSPNQNIAGMQVRRLDTDATASLNGSTMGTAWRIRMDEMLWSTGAGTIYLDGAVDVSNASLTSAGTTSDTAAGNNTLTIAAAAHTTPAAGFGDIDLACLIICTGSALSSDNRHRLEGWAAWQLGLEGNLPVGHPYKDAPPQK